MFACTEPDKRPARITIKLDPLHRQLLRSPHASVQPGDHMNKDHGNPVTLSQETSEDEVLAWIDESYEWVVRNLSRADRRSLGL